MALTKAEKRVQSYEEKEAKKKAKEKAFELRLTEVVSFGGGSIALGFIETKFPGAAAFGPGGKMSASLVAGIGGLGYALGYKKAKPREREIAMGLGMAGLQPTLRGFGESLAINGLSFGG